MKRSSNLILPGFILVAWGVLLPLRLDAADERSGGFSDPAAIEERLASARAELKALPEAASSDLRVRLEQLEAACQYHLAGTDLLTAAQEELATARREASAWSGFPQPPPHSVLLLDEIREFHASREAAERSYQAQIRIFKPEVERLQLKLSGHRQAERRFMEIAEKASSPESLLSARQATSIENLSARITAEKIGRRQLRIAAERAILDAVVVHKELAARKLQAINGNTIFSRAELDRLLQQIARERAEVAGILVEESKTQQAPDPLLIWKIEFLDLRKDFWEARFTAINSEDPSKARAAAAALKGLQGRVDDWVEIADLRLTGGDSETANADPALHRESDLQVREMQRRIGFAISDLEGWSLRGRGTPLLDRIISTLKAVWDAELYLVEESDIADGKKIAIFRAITVGKLVRLAFILVVGWFALRFLSRRINATVARRGKIPQATADLAGKWAFGFGLFLLVLYGLHAVSIPLTVFAFLGGALAIGIGFGTQTLLKNFISGIILLFERPLKVGDVIEVAGITGTIKLIGIRASVVQHFDGIETLVPNSILLENELTNWSFSSTVIRHSVLVGVAYGSPTREVTRLLLAVAAEHGLVKDDPAPEVRFDDFGDNSLTFCLLFWLDTKKIRRSTLASDLRHMIDRAFADAGVTIAFPQRDLHFDPDAPLRVELSRAPKPVPPAARGSVSGSPAGSDQSHLP